MRAFGKILLIAVLSVFAWKAAGFFDCHTVDRQDECVGTVLVCDGEAALHSAGGLEGDYRRGGYNDWNLPELSASQGQLTTGRPSEQSSRVNSSESQHVTQSWHKTAFVKGGRILNIHQALKFIEDAGLFPSGNCSFSHHLISLRKMRL